MDDSFRVVVGVLVPLDEVPQILLLSFARLTLLNWGRDENAPLDRVCWPIRPATD
jgi:hypothetical protein